VADERERVYVISGQCRWAHEHAALRRYVCPSVSGQHLPVPSRSFPCRSSLPC
jgi:hypothetical protein